MTDAFDPYQQWLGVSSCDGLPDHYSLLGLRPGESDPEVIANAVQWREVLVRTFESGLLADQARGVLEQIAAARACLLDPAAKAAYDETLRDRAQRHRFSLFLDGLSILNTSHGIALSAVLLVMLLGSWLVGLFDRSPDPMDDLLATDDQSASAPEEPKVAAERPARPAWRPVPPREPGPTKAAPGAGGGWRPQPPPPASAVTQTADVPPLDELLHQLLGWLPSREEGRAGRAGETSAVRRGEPARSGGAPPAARSRNVAPQEIRSLAGHTGSVTALATTPSGVLLVSAGEDRTLRMWNLLTSDQVWKRETQSDRLTSIAVSRDGEFLVSNDDDRYLVQVDAADGCIRRWLGPVPGPPVGLSLTPDGQDLIWATSSNPPQLVEWNLAQNRPTKRLDCEDDPLALTISPDGQRLATGDERGRICVRSIPTGEVLYQLAAHRDAVIDIGFSPDGHRLVSGSRNEIVVLEIGVPRPLYTLGVESVRSVAFSPDGRRLAAAAAGRPLWFWDAATGQPIEPLQTETASSEHPVTRIVFLPDPRGLVTGDSAGTIRLWRLPD